MPKYLTQEWLDEAKKLAEGQPERPRGQAAPAADPRDHRVLSALRLPRAPLRPFAAAVTVLALAGVACGRSGSKVTSTPPTTVPPAQSRAAAEATRSGAAVLRARLSTLLQAHAYLVGLMTAAAADGTDPGPVRSVVDANDGDLAGAVGEVFTPAFVKHAPTRYAGAPDSAAATLLTVSEDLLQEHVFVLAVTTGAQLTGADVKAASNTLDLNSEALANVLVSAYGSAAGATFL